MLQPDKHHTIMISYYEDPPSPSLMPERRKPFSAIVLNSIFDESDFKYLRDFDKFMSIEPSLPFPYAPTP